MDSEVKKPTISPSDDIPGQEASQTMEQSDWGKLAAITATIFLLFFYTRSCPFPTGLYWDLLTGRDFPATTFWLVSPEKLTFFLQSFASLFGLKAVYHILFFLICGVLTVVAFQGRESLPNIIILGIFAFAVQPLLNLRDMLLMLVMVILLTAFEKGIFRNAYGLALVPLSAVTAILGLPAWLIPVLVLCHILWGDNAYPILLLCSLVGIVIFMDASMVCLFGSPSLAHRFHHPDDLKLLNMLGAIFLVPNLVALPILGDIQLPNLAFYCVIGIMALVNPAYSALFALVGVFLLLTALSKIPSLSLNANLLGVIVLAAVFHLFLFLNPYGFRLNPSVREEVGPGLAPLINGQVKSRRVQPFELGEYVWKGLATIHEDDISWLERNPPLWITNTSGRYDLTTVSSSSDEENPKKTPTPDPEIPAELDNSP